MDLSWFRYFLLLEYSSSINLSLHGLFLQLSQCQSLWYKFSLLITSILLVLPIPTSLMTHLLYFDAWALIYCTSITSINFVYACSCPNNNNLEVLFYTSLLTALRFTSSLRNPIKCYPCMSHKCLKIFHNVLKWRYFNVFLKLFYGYLRSIT